MTIYSRAFDLERPASLKTPEAVICESDLVRTAECPHNEGVVSRQVPPLEFSLFSAGNCSRSLPFAGGKRLGECEIAIGAVRDYSLTCRQPELFAIELYRDNVGFE